MAKVAGLLITPIERGPSATRHSLNKLRASGGGMSQSQCRSVLADRIIVVAVELTDTSIPYDTEKYPFPLALVVGHETDGVSKKTMEESA